MIRWDRAMRTERVTEDWRSLVLVTSGSPQRPNATKGVTQLMTQTVKLSSTCLTLGALLACFLGGSLALGPSLLLPALTTGATTLFPGALARTGPTLAPAFGPATTGLGSGTTRASRSSRSKMSSSSTSAIGTAAGAATEAGRAADGAGAAGGGGTEGGGRAANCWSSSRVAGLENMEGTRSASARSAPVPSCTRLM